MLTKNQIKTLPLGLVNFWTAYQAAMGTGRSSNDYGQCAVLVIYLFSAIRYRCNVHQWYEN